MMSYITHTSTLVDSFNALADEVQSLTDRNTILEHKLRFAHEQVRTTLLVNLSASARLGASSPQTKHTPSSMMNIIALDQETASKCTEDRQTLPIPDSRFL